ncbi:MAG: biotin--[acetyl-CoA-carboxylase] ligase [Elusimicrobiota bacterium]|jgi:BirA family biotin operon repressor/biotin-[acetyl-CoA-carboxylase] ligase|nr:biotin--[acetyl-CoA-carboxylase] ligase [Elusimicrobiota bacterium]
MQFKFELNRIIELDEVTSTQDIAKELAQTLEEGNVLVQAKSQTNGRGRFERGWDAQAGGLYISLILRPDRQVKNTAALSVKTGMAVAKTLRELYGVKTKIKLPNDVLALQNGVYKKIAGVLIETSLQQESLNWLALGIGVNLNNKVCAQIKAASVKQIIKREADITEFRDALLRNFAGFYLQWGRGV